MTDFFDLGEDDERVLDALRALLRETGLDPYLDLRTPDRASRAGGVLLVLNRAERLLEELRDLDEGVAAAGVWEAVVFKTDPDLPGLYKADARAPAVLADDAAALATTVMDRARDATRREAVDRALVSIGDLRRAVRIQG